jgi:galactokinase
VRAEQAVQEGRAGFASRFGGEPEGVWWAPGRVNIIGEHTDYQLGLCLPMAIDRHVVVAARPRPDRRVRAYSAALQAAAEADLDGLRPGPRGDWFNYVAGVLAGLEPPRGVDLYIGGDLPRGAGLSSSAALEVAVAWAVNDLFALGLEPEELALVAQRAEHTFAGVSCGIMDQFASVFGRPGRALLLDTRSRTVTPVPFQPEEVGLVLGVVDTRAPHQVTGGGYQERFEQARAAARLLGLDALRDATPEDLVRVPDPVLRRRARHIVSENGRVLQVVEAAARGEWAAVGQALYASHRSLAEDYEVSHPALDLVVQTASATEGVFGARLTGAGFGGSAIVLMEALAEEDFLQALRRAYAERGWAPFAYLPVRAGPGAGRCPGAAAEGEYRARAPR